MKRYLNELQHRHYKRCQLTLDSVKISKNGITWEDVTVKDIAADELRFYAPTKKYLVGESIQVRFVMQNIISTHNFNLKGKILLAKNTTYTLRFTDISKEEQINLDSAIMSSCSCCLIAE